jgi:hypothetical protein
VIQGDPRGSREIQGRYREIQGKYKEIQEIQGKYSISKGDKGDPREIQEIQRRYRRSKGDPEKSEGDREVRECLAQFPVVSPLGEGFGGLTEVADWNT